jgi:integrase
MQEISKACGFNPAVRPHDLRRTMGTMIAARGHGREAMDRILNHKIKSTGDVYDRHRYSREDELIMKDVSSHIMRLVEGKGEDDNVMEFKKAQ